MKIKDNFVTYDSENEQIMVPVEDSGFIGLVRSNHTASFIVNCLKKDTTKDEIVNKMLKQYDASCETIEKSVDDILDKLRKIGALDE